MGQGSVGGLGINLEHRLVGHPRGTQPLVEVELGPGNRMLRRGQQVGGARREGRQQKGEGDLVLLREERWCLPPQA